MMRADADRWNERYHHDPRFASYENERDFLVENEHYLPTTGLAFDAAMGLGGSAAFLIAHGLRVIGADISEVALQKAHARLPTLMAVLTDLALFSLPADTFNVIINFYYLQRNLWSQYPSALKRGGLLIIETLTVDMLAIQPDIQRGFLLEAGELRTAFPNMEILLYREGIVTGKSGHQKAIASLIAKKI
jgi:hypothetical protein